MHQLVVIMISIKKGTLKRTDFIFRNLIPSPMNSRRHFKQEFALVILGAKLKNEEAMSLWL